MKTVIALTFSAILASTLLAADEMLGRDKESLLDVPVYKTIAGAIAIAAKSDRRIFAVIFNPSNTKGMSSNYRILAFFTDKEEVRSLIKSNFVQAFLSNNSPSTRKYLPDADNVKTPFIVIMDKTGKTLASEPMSDGHVALAQAEKFARLPK